MTFKSAALNLINNERAARGLAPLQASTALDRVAQDGDFDGCGGTVVRGRCQDMGERNYFSHSVKDCGNKSFTHMLNAAGIVHSGAGENVAFVSAMDEEEAAAANLHSQLMGHNSHANNILSTSFTHVGIGVWRTETGKSWTGMNTPLQRVFITSQIFARNPVPVDAGPPAVTGGAYHVLTPARLLDTRTAGGPLGPGATRDLQVTGAGGVPPGARAVVLTVAVATPTTGGFLTVFPAGEPRPTAANVNFTPGLTVANTAIVKVGAGGKVSLFNHDGSTHVIVDVAGWFDGPGSAAGPLYHPVVPSRILDTRSSAPVGPGAILDLPVLNRGGVPPAGVAAVVVSLTAVTPSASGFLTVFPTGTPTPPTNNLNFTAGANVPNLVVAGVGAGGAISICNSAGHTHLVADVAGWFDQGNMGGGARYNPVTPARVLDTRLGVGVPVPAAKVGPGATLDLKVSNAGGVPPSGASAVVLNVAVAGPTAQSFLTVFPAGDPRPNTANLTFVAGQVVSNLVMAKLGPGGRLSIFNQAGATDVIADVAGWFDGG